MSLVETLFYNFLSAVLLESMVIPTLETCILYFRLSRDLRTGS